MMRHLWKEIWSAARAAAAGRFVCAPWGYMRMDGGSLVVVAGSSGCTLDEFGVPGEGPGHRYLPGDEVPRVAWLCAFVRDAWR